MQLNIINLINEICLLVECQILRVKIHCNMAIENRRLRQIIYHLMKDTKPQTSESLATLVSVSQRTIKSDMLILKDELTKIGAELITRKGVGYTINIIDRIKFDPFFEQLTYYRLLVGAFMSDRIARFVYIARTLVASEDYIKIEEIADDMYLSSSSIKQEMKSIYSFLNSYHLDIDSKVGKGIRVIGSEENIRLAIVELVVNRYHKIKITDSSEQYAKILECSEELRQKIRRNFLATYRASGMFAIDDETLHFAFYLVVLRNRVKNGHTIKLSDEMLKELTNLEEYSLAQKVIDNLQEIEGFDVSDHEIAFIALLFHCMRDLSISDVKCTMPHYNDANILADEIIQSIVSVWNIHLNENTEFKQNLVSRLIPILGQIKYGLSSNQRIVADMSAHEIGASPLSIELSRTVVRFIESKYFCRINSRLFTRIAFLVFSAISRIKYDIRKLKLLTISMGGKQSGIELVDRINRRFSEMIESNESVEFYEIRGFDQSKYDFVIMNEAEFSYFYTIPYFRLDTVTLPYQLSKLYDEVLINAYQIDAYIPSCNGTHVYTSFEFESQVSFFKMIAYKYGVDTTQCSLLFEMLNENEKFFSYNVDYESIILFLPYKMCHSEVIDYYQLQMSQEWGMGNISHIIVIISDFTQSLQKTKALENISRSLMINAKFVESIETNPCPKEYRKLIQACLTSE